MGVYVEQIPPNVTLEQLIPILQRVVDYINNSQRTTIINDGGTDRYLIGYQKSGWGPGKDFGIKVSKEGVNVNTATDAELILKFDFTTEYRYSQTGNNWYQIGKLPDNTDGVAVAKQGGNVADAFS